MSSLVSPVLVVLDSPNEGGVTPRATALARSRRTSPRPTTLGCRQGLLPTTGKGIPA
jgi:hypothetical protein